MDRTKSVGAVCVMLACLAVLPGCATDARQTRSTQQGDKEKADFFWPYAALAADVYRTRGEVDSHIATALASPWLRREIETSGDQAAKDRFSRLGYPEAEQLYRESLREKCKAERLLAGAAESDDIQTPACQFEALTKAETVRLQTEAGNEPNRFRSQEPRDKDDCEYSSHHQPWVPIDTLGSEYGWTRVPELQRQTSVRSWSIFVPELAIDVWRRARPMAGSTPVMEYAIVYRGTVGGGGWVSNFRGLTAMLPFVWDQYRQALQATEALINQIDRLHTVSDELLQRKQPTQLLFTAVGHSLGGGLAQYLYLRQPRITRVVAFDPSPIDGSSTIPLDKRQAVTDGMRRRFDRDPRDEQAAIHVLFEDGEFISELAPCHTGRVWGDEGGPWVRCERVDFSRGNAFRQHNMAQLACKLYLSHTGRSPR
jgi:pimeloyl-ACP methyl ester carboxylesterase